MSLAWKNKLPFRIGPGPTRTEQIYAALRSAQGTNQSGQSAAGPADGLRDLWTQCIAAQIARRGNSTERAVLQIWPATMTSALSTWEGLLGLPTAKSAPARVAAITAAIATQLDATIPGLRTNLSNIDPNLSVLLVPWAQARVTEPGKSFQGLPGTSPPSFFGSGPLALAGRVATAYPMFGDGHLVLVTFTSTLAQPIPIPSTVQAVTTLMNGTLPSYASWSIGTISPGSGGSGPGGAGLFCDGKNASRCDYTRCF